jgi:caa(3)-type oxidase subunit IV
VDVRGSADLSSEFASLIESRQERLIMATGSTHTSGSLTRDLIVYICLLVLAGIQFVIAYQDISTSQMFLRMMIVAVIEAGLAVLFFMHLSENRGLRWFVIIFAVGAILGMQYGWTDSYRLINGVPWAH